MLLQENEKRFPSFSTTFCQNDGMKSRLDNPYDNIAAKIPLMCKYYWRFEMHNSAGAIIYFSIARLEKAPIHFAIGVCSSALDS